MKLKSIFIVIIFLNPCISYSQSIDSNNELDTQIAEFVFQMASNPNFQLNEIPMYGGVAITELQKISNDNLIIEIEIMDVTREEALEQAIMRGWEFFNSGDILTSIKRFNQAWLMNPGHPEVYYGFGDYLGMIEEFEGAILIFKSLSAFL